MQTQDPLFVALYFDPAIGTASQPWIDHFPRMLGSYLAELRTKVDPQASEQFRAEIYPRYVAKVASYAKRLKGTLMGLAREGYHPAVILNIVSHVIVTMEPHERHLAKLRMVVSRSRRERAAAALERWAKRYLEPCFPEFYSVEAPDGHTAFHLGRELASVRFICNALRHSAWNQPIEVDDHFLTITGGHPDVLRNQFHRKLIWYFRNSGTRRPHDQETANLIAALFPSNQSSENFVANITRQRQRIEAKNPPPLPSL
jgi:hypothetical protein